MSDDDIERAKEMMQGLHRNGVALHFTAADQSVYLLFVQRLRDREAVLLLMDLQFERYYELEPAVRFLDGAWQPATFNVEDFCRCLVLSRRRPRVSDGALTVFDVELEGLPRRAAAVNLQQVPRPFALRVLAEHVTRLQRYALKLEWSDDDEADESARLIAECAFFAGVMVDGEGGIKRPLLCSDFARIVEHINRLPGGVAVGPADSIDVRNLEEEIAVKDRRITELQELLDRCEKNSRDLESENGNLKNTMEGLQREVRILQDAVTGHSGAGAEVEALQQQLSDLKAQNSALQEELQEEKDRYAELQEELETEKTKYENELQEKDEKLEESAREQERKNEELQNELQAELTEKDDALKAMQNELQAELTEKDDALKAMQNELQAQLTEKDDALKVMQNELQVQLTEKDDALKAMQNELQGEKVRNEEEKQKMREDLELEKEKNAALENQLVASNEQNEACMLQNEIQQMKLEKIFQELSQDKDALREKMKAKDEELKGLQEENQSLQEQKQQMEQNLAAVVTREEQLATTNNALSSEIQALTDEVQELQVRLHATAQAESIVQSEWNNMVQKFEQCVWLNYFTTSHAARNIKEYTDRNQTKQIFEQWKNEITRKINEQNRQGDPITKELLGELDTTENLVLRDLEDAIQLYLELKMVLHLQDDDHAHFLVFFQDRKVVEMIHEGIADIKKEDQIKFYAFLATVMQLRHDLSRYGELQTKIKTEFGVSQPLTAAEIDMGVEESPQADPETEALMQELNVLLGSGGALQ